MKQYLDILENILTNGKIKDTRTGINAMTIDGTHFEHDMSGGFPLLTTKKVPFRLVSSELEFFIKGLTDKKWLQDKNNHIWDEWCNPEKVPYGTDKATKKKMLEERDLGPIYGFQWRHFGAKYQGYDIDYDLFETGLDQLKQLVETIKKDSNNRRMIISAWNPIDLEKMALPPCHYSFQVTVTDENINLFWNQRSVDTMLGLPFNIASYALLLHLLSKSSGFKEGRLVGNLGDTHIYENHIEGAKEQLKREPRKLPSIETDAFTDIFKWEYIQSKVINYNPHPSIKFDIAV
jgi:thymidylate synthase